MNDEIREILDRLKEDLYIPQEDNREYKLLDKGDDKLLLDCITNLQKENEDNLKCIKSLKEQLESVINENQRLLKQWFEDNDKTVKLVSEKECYKQNFNDYKLRVEKATEILHNLNDTLPLDLILSEIEHSENILQNGSESK